MASFSPDYEAYLAHSTDAGIQIFEPLTIRHVVNVGEEERGVFTVKDVKDEALICAIPYCELLSIDHFDNTPLASLKNSIASVDNQLALLLCYEQGLGEASKWGYHLRVCPKFYHSLLNWSDDEVEMLDGTSLYPIAIQWRRQAQDDFKIMTKALKKSADPTLSSTYTSWFSYDQYLWSLSTIFSRFVSIRREGKMMNVMAPVFDLFNHSFRGSKAMHGFREESDALIIVSVGDHVAGEEIFLSYGPLSSHTLLMKYGMVFANNPYDTIDIFAPFSPDTPHFTAKNKMLLDTGIDCNNLPFPMRRGELPTLLLAALRVQKAGSSGDDSGELS